MDNRHRIRRPLTSPVAADDITDEIVQIGVDVVNSWYAEGRIDWENVLDRTEGTELADGTELDWGTDTSTPAIAAFKRRVRSETRD